MLNNEIKNLKLTERGFELLSEKSSTLSLPEYKHLGTGLRFVLIPPGDFIIGSEDAFADTDESPAHKVVLTRYFLMARTPCTQLAWRLGIEGTNLKGEVRELAELAKFPTFGNADEKPVYHVTWKNCLDWCTVNGLELPTEAQWEYACRAGTTSRFWFGDVDLEDWDELDRWLWYSEHNNGEVPSVALKEPNAWGLFDMHGTVWEWCRDQYDPHFYTTDNSVDPCNISSGYKRIHRGGAWDVPSICCRASARYRDADDYCLGSIGFRPSLTL